MERDEILAKSREENKDRDLYKTEVEARAASVGVIAASVLATVFFVVRMLAGGGFDFGLYAILCAVGAAHFIYKAAHMRQGRYVALAVVYTVGTLALGAAHLYTLLV